MNINLGLDEFKRLVEGREVHLAVSCSPHPEYGEHAVTIVLEGVGFAGMRQLVNRAEQAGMAYVPTSPPLQAYRFPDGPILSYYTPQSGEACEDCKAVGIVVADDFPIEDRGFFALVWFKDYDADLVFCGACAMRRAEAASAEAVRS